MFQGVDQKPAIHCAKLKNNI